MRLSRGCPLALLLVTAALGGCGEAFDKGDPPEPPTDAELSRIVAATRQPGYWLGPRFRGIAISAVAVSRRGVSLSYGPWTCDSGCTDSGDVYSGRRDLRVLSQIETADEDVDPKACWSRLGRAVAVLLDCFPDGYPQNLVIYSGDREISVTSLYSADGKGDIAVRSVARRLRPLNANAQWPLPRPKPLTCRQLKRVDARYRRHMPRALRPRSAC